MNENDPQQLVLNMPGQELIMWDGTTGTAYTLARERYTMTPRVRAMTIALLELALSEMDKVKPIETN